MLEPNGTAAADAAFAAGLFGDPGSVPAAVPVTTAQQVQQPVQPVARPVANSDGDAPLPGHRSFNAGNRSHVDAPIIIPTTPTQQPVQQPLLPQQQAQQPQQFQLTLPGFPAQPAQQPTAQPVLPGAFPVAPGAVPGQPQQQADPAQQQGHQVPVHVMLEERRRAQEANATLTAMQEQVREAQALNQRLVALLQGTIPQQQAQQEEIIDPDVDLRGHLAQQQRHIQRMIHEGISSIRQEQQAARDAQLNDAINASQDRAEAKYGAPYVAAVYQAVKANGMGRHFISKADPYEEMHKWYQGQMMVQQMGSNPSAYMNNLTQQIRAQVLAELRGNTSPPTNIPPSLANATSAMTSHAVVPATNDFFVDMFARRVAPAQHPARVA